MVQPLAWFKHARHSSEHAVLPNPSIEGDVQGLAPRPSCQTLNIMREAIAEVSTQLSEVVGVIERHLEPTLLAVHLYGSPAVDMAAEPHSDIDLLVTVTVRLDETTRRALINDLLETSASHWKARFSAL